MSLYVGSQKINPAVLISGGGSGGTEDSGGKYLVQVIDWDGKIIKQDHLDSNSTFTLPTPPVHTNLTFDGWSSPVTITNNTVTVGKSDLTIGATYHITNEISEFVIDWKDDEWEIIPTLELEGTKNWGDGTIDQDTTHTYSSNGEYTITCNCEGTVFPGFLNAQQDMPNYYSTVKLSNKMELVDGAFVFCNGLRHILLPSNLESIGSEATFCWCSSLESLVIPEGVTSIGSSAFAPDYGDSSNQYASMLRSIAIPSSVTSIGDYAFSGCSSLTSVTIPEGVTSIGDYAFGGCSSLTSVTIPEGVTSIGDYAFLGCFSMIEYDFTSHLQVPTLSSKALGPVGQDGTYYPYNRVNFSNNCKIKVPASLESQWKVATNWAYYADYIVGV